jgi:hypothetical protein
MSSYHSGHQDEKDLRSCPVARMKTYIHGEFQGPYEVGSQLWGCMDLFFMYFALVGTS